MMNVIPFPQPVKVNDIIHDNYMDKWGVVRYGFLNTLEKNAFYLECVLTNTVITYWLDYPHFVKEGFKLSRGEYWNLTLHRTSGLSEINLDCIDINNDK